MWNPSTCDCECNKAFKIGKYLDGNCSCEKWLIGNLVLECEDEILNITRTSLNDEKVVCGKSNCLIHTISMVNYILVILWCHF